MELARFYNAGILKTTMAEGDAWWLYRPYRGRGVIEKAAPNRAAAGFWGTVAGFTSVIFFAITNAVKLVPHLRSDSSIPRISKRPRRTARSHFHAFWVRFR